LSSNKPIIALDADGVLLDYHQAYQAVWALAFGEPPAVKDPLAYWPQDRFDVSRLVGEELEFFRGHFDEIFWATIPAIHGSVEACNALDEAGYELICVSAFDNKYLAAREENLRNCGFPIGRVIATESGDNIVSPKSMALKEIQPVAFIDDYLPYLRGIPASVHSALIMRDPNGSPNVGKELELAHSMHADLQDFSTWWLSTMHTL